MSTRTRQQFWARVLCKMLKWSQACFRTSRRRWSPRWRSPSSSLTSRPSRCAVPDPLLISSTKQLCLLPAVSTAAEVEESVKFADESPEPVRIFIRSFARQCFLLPHPSRVLRLGHTHILWSPRHSHHYLPEATGRTQFKLAYTRRQLPAALALSSRAVCLTTRFVAA